MTAERERLVDDYNDAFADAFVRDPGDGDIEQEAHSVALVTLMARAKAEALEEAAAYLSEPGRVWHGDGGVTVMLDDQRMTRQPLTEWLCARADECRTSKAAE